MAMTIMRCIIITKKILRISLIFPLIILQYGCNNQNFQMTTHRIEQLLFNDVKQVKMIVKSQPSRELIIEEIRVLRTSIRNATNLTELDDKDMPDINTKSIVTFIITWNDCTICNLFYDRDNQNMYLYKDQVRFRDKTKYKIRPGEYDKLMLGIFRFHPSDRMRDLVL